MSYLYSGTIRDIRGNAYETAVVSVYTDSAGTTLAALMDSDGNPVANPTSTDDRGRIEVYANEARLWYRVAGDTRVMRLVRFCDLTQTVVSGLPFISVMDHGAAGDGLTDDTAAIQEAIDAASGAEGRVFMPTGTYLVGTTDTPIALKSGVTLFGSGGDSVLKLADSSPLSPSYGMIYANAVSDVAVMRLAIDGNRDNVAALIRAILFYNVAGGLVDLVKLFDIPEAGVYVNGTDGTTRSERCAVTRCDIDNTVGTGIRVGASLGTRVHGNIVTGSRNDGCVALTYGAEGAIVSGNYLDQEAVVGSSMVVWIRGALGAAIVGNTIRRGGSYGVLAQVQQSLPQHSERITIAGNDIDQGSAGSGIALVNQQTSGTPTGISDVVIADNVVRGCAEHSIVASPVSGVAPRYERITVKGNIVRGGSKRGISLATADDVAVAGNLVGAPGQYGVYLEGFVGGTVDGNVVDMGAANYDAIRLYDTTLVAVKGNHAHDSAQYGIREAGTSDYNIVSGNITKATLGIAAAPANSVHADNIAVT